MDDETALDTIDLRFLIAVRDHTHLEAALRNLRRTPAVIRRCALAAQLMGGDRHAEYPSARVPAGVGSITIAHPRLQKGSGHRRNPADLSLAAVGPPMPMMVMVRVTSRSST